MHRRLLFCMVLILSFGVIGTSYAGWQDAVLIRADAATGKLAVGLRCLSLDTGCCRCCQDKECHRQEPDVTWNSGCFSFELNGSSYYESVNLTFTSPCPCFSPVCSLEIANGGTIPARVKNLSLEWWGDEGTVAPGEWTVVFPDGCQKSGSSAAGLRGALRGTVLDPGEKILVELDFRFRSRGDLAGCSIGVDCLRWNQNL